MSECPPAVGASALDGRDPILVEVYNRLVGGSALGDDWVAAELAGVGSFVGKGLGMSGGTASADHVHLGGIATVSLHSISPPGIH